MSKQIPSQYVFSSWSQLIYSAHKWQLPFHYSFQLSGLLTWLHEFFQVYKSHLAAYHVFWKAKWKKLFPGRVEEDHLGVVCWCGRGLNLKICKTCMFSPACGSPCCQTCTASRGMEPSRVPILLPWWFWGGYALGSGIHEVSPTLNYWGVLYRL